MSRYFYPKLDIPFESRINPRVDEVDQELRKWAFLHKLHDERAHQKYSDEDLARLAARMYPDGDFERSVMAGKFVVHAFALNDAIADHKQGTFFGSLMKYEGSNENAGSLLDQVVMDNDTPVANSFADLWASLKNVTNETWQNRFAENFIWHLKGDAWEANNSETMRVPPLVEYLELRHYSAGINCIFNMLEVSKNMFIPDSVMANPTLQRLTHLAGCVIRFTNDIHSFEKEKRHGDVHNLVIVMKEEYKISYQEAVTRAIAYVNDEVKKYIALEPFVPSFGPKNDLAIHQYLSGLRNAMRGNFEWMLSTKRYARYEYSDDQF